MKYYLLAAIILFVASVSFSLRAGAKTPAGCTTDADCCVKFKGICDGDEGGY